MSTAERRERVVVTVVSCLVTLVAFAAWPGRTLADDGAIYLRYMNQFRDGHFATYNVEDGPVFGMSGALFGLASGLFAWSRVVSPTGALLAMDAVGCAVTLAMSHRILRRFTTDPWLAGAGILVAFVFAPHAEWVVRQGLETPFHVALLLVTLHATLEGATPRTRMLLAVACVISKLDAALFALAVWALAAHDAWKGGGARQALRTSIVAAGLPLAAWVLFCVRVFGSPLPTSAYAKYAAFRRPASTGFPLLGTYWANEPLAWPLFVSAFLGLVVAAMVAFRARAPYPEGTPSPSSRVPGPLVAAPAIAAALVLVIYWRFDPGEWMPWYLVVPEVLLGLQAAVGFVVLAERFLVSPTSRRGLVVATCLAVVPVLCGTIVRTNDGVRNFQEIVQEERARTGRWIEAHSSPDERVLTCTGAIAAATSRYVIDSCGLNHRAALAIRMEGRPLEELRPAFVESFDPNAIPVWEFVASFYDIASAGLAPIRIFHRPSRQLPVLPRWEDVPAGSVGGGTVVPTSFEFPSPDGLSPVKFYWADGVVLSFRLPGPRVVEAVEMGIRRGSSARRVRIDFDGCDPTFVRIEPASRSEGVTASVSLRTPCTRPVTEFRVRAEDVAPVSVGQPIVRYAAP
ncbi:MAG: hypothetical protein U0169_15400 [Polyangiaceae bacterium]